MSRSLIGVLTLGLIGCPQAPTPEKPAEKKTDGPTAKVDAKEQPKEEAVPAEKPATDEAALNSGPAKTLATATNRFGFDMYGQLRGEPGNIVMSPASIELALLMTWGGARDGTAAEMAKVLHLGELGESAHASAGEMLAAWNDPSRSTYELAVVNRIFTERTAPIEPDFIELTKKHYGAGYEALDFRKNFEPSRLHINEWVAKQTKDRIQDLLPENSLDELTRLVLTNAVYFLGQWDAKFDEDATKSAAFFVDGKTKAQVDTMHQTATLGLARPTGLAVLEMPYVGKELAMVVILPDDRDGLAAVEGRLAAEYDRWISELTPQSVEVAFPRFRIEMPASIALKKPLEALGMPVSFTDAANFEGMSNPPDAREKLKIADVYHKAFVEVNEEGTEAAAATAVVMQARGAAPQQEQFNADHPFIFAIRDLRNGALLFIGRVNDPRGAG